MKFLWNSNSFLLTELFKYKKKYFHWSHLDHSSLGNFFESKFFLGYNWHKKFLKFLVSFLEKKNVVQNLLHQFPPLNFAILLTWFHINLAGIFSNLLLFQLKQDGFHSSHIFCWIFVSIFATKITKFGHSFPLSSRSDIVDFSHEFFFIFTVIFLGFIQIFLIPFIPRGKKINFKC